MELCGAREKDSARPGLTQKGFCATWDWKSGRTRRRSLAEKGKITVSGGRGGRGLVFFFERQKRSLKKKAHDHLDHLKL